MTIKTALTGKYYRETLIETFGSARHIWEISEMVNRMLPATVCWNCQTGEIYSPGKINLTVSDVEYLIQRCIGKLACRFYA